MAGASEMAEAIDPGAARHTASLHPQQNITNNGTHSYAWDSCLLHVGMQNKLFKRPKVLQMHTLRLGVCIIIPPHHKKFHYLPNSLMIMMMCSVADNQVFSSVIDPL